MQTSCLKYLVSKGSPEERLESMNTRLGAGCRQLEALEGLTEKRLKNVAARYEEGFQAATNNCKIRPLKRRSNFGKINEKSNKKIAIQRKPVFTYPLVLRRLQFS